jgi:hypothetical protein
VKGANVHVRKAMCSVSRALPCTYSPKCDLYLRTENPVGSVGRWQTSWQVAQLTRFHCVAAASQMLHSTAGSRSYGRPASPRSLGAFCGTGSSTLDLLQASIDLVSERVPSRGLRQKLCSQADQVRSLLILASFFSWGLQLRR